MQDDRDRLVVAAGVGRSDSRTAQRQTAHADAVRSPDLRALARGIAARPRAGADRRGRGGEPLRPRGLGAAHDETRRRPLAADRCGWIRERWSRRRSRRRGACVSARRPSAVGVVLDELGGSRDRHRARVPMDDRRASSTARSTAVRSSSCESRRVAVPHGRYADRQRVGRLPASPSAGPLAGRQLAACHFWRSTGSTGKPITRPPTWRVAASDVTKREGWQGWDEYAPFYDWENAQTLGRRDVPFWRRAALQARGPVLELGCGTGRVTMPLARAGVDIVGIDRSAPMLRAPARLTKSPTRHARQFSDLVRGDIRALPFAARSFSMVLAPYGILQSLIETARSRRDARVGGACRRARRHLRDRSRAGCPEVARVRQQGAAARAESGGAAAHADRIGPAGPAPPTHDVRAALCGTAGAARAITVSSCVPDAVGAGRCRGSSSAQDSGVEAVLGDYRGRAWDERADVWIIMARRKQR